MKLPVSAVVRVAVGAVFVTAALLSACDNKEIAAPTSTRSDPATAGTQVPDPYKDSSHGDVACGPVGPEGGEQSNLVAIATEAGTVGCEEAFAVIGEYYRDAPRRSSGQGPLDVRGWNCMNGYGVNPACTKDGLLFYAEEQY